MTPQDVTQLKILALEAAGGNIEEAINIFAWLSDEFIETEIARRKKRDCKLQEDIVQALTTE